MIRLEDFQSGTPLTPELAKLKAGILDEPAPAPKAESVWEQDDADRELTDSEREELRKLTAEPGWRVLIRLRKKALRHMERAAIIVSQTNPLANAQKIAIGWANVDLYKKVAETDMLAMEAEIQRLKAKGI